MKRVEERVKVGDANAGNPGVASVFPQSRSLIDQLPTQPVSVASQPPSGPPSFQRVIAHGTQGGVSVYREGGATTITATSGPPPVAHAASGGTQQHPPAPQPVVTQPPSNIKPEPIKIMDLHSTPFFSALPTTPVSVQYTTFPPTLNQTTALTAVKTMPISTQVNAGAASAAAVIHSITQQNAHHRGPAWIIHQKAPHLGYAQPAGIRTISSATLQPTPPSAPTVPASVIPTTAQGGAAGGNNQFQRLKVEDALSYLDQVKYKFGNQPQVYNDFLDIMKEFKSQTIDTPGVIARVSMLFKGHPELIVGFNTFLPPGYKIEVTCNDQMANPGIIGSGMQTIVHTPHGVHTMSGTGHMSALQVTTTQAAPVPVRPVPITQHTPTAVPVAAPVGGAPVGGVAAAKHAPAPVKPNAVELPVPPRGDTVQMTFVPSDRLPPNNAPVSVALNSPNLGRAPPATPPHSAQPVEFNHAINYVNKIKNRFQGQPDVYKQFLEILHTYQKDQKAIKDGQPPSSRHLTEAEVYAQVATLFKNQEDLLSEFGQFLPEATGDYPSIKESSKGLNNDHISVTKKPKQFSNTKFGSASMKRPPSGITHPPPKKIKTGVLRDVSLAEAGKFGTLNEYAFFDKVRKAMRSTEAYDNFLRCLILFNQEVISRNELVQLTTPFLNKHPDLFKWFKDFVGFKEGSVNQDTAMVASGVRNERMSQGDTAMEIDYATCKRLGASYCALPKNFVQPKCSGRTDLCREVLNDTWVSFPSWSEDSQFVSSRKTQYEEFIYRTEDERFEFDVVLETNKDTIKVLECVQKKMSRMPPEEAARYRLDDTLGGSSTTIHQRAIKRIYGDKAADIIDGLKRNPVVAVPLVLRRLKSKDEEWRECAKNFNKIWRDQNEKYYLKSLDHQGLLFKQSDIRNLRSKSLLNEIETLYDERHEQEESNGGDPIVGPHLTLEYQDPVILDDANNLLIHHVKRQTGIHKDDKHKIKVLLRHFLLDLFKHPRQELSDDEKEDEDDEDKDDDNDSDNQKSSRGERAKKKREEKDKKEKSKQDQITEADIKIENKDGRRTPLHSRDMDPAETYSHMMCNNNWYLFLRLHQILCDRLTKTYNQAVIIASEESKEKKDRKESIAVSLRLKPKRLCLRRHLTSLSSPFDNIFTSAELPSTSSEQIWRNEIDPEDYYPAFLDMVKNVLDGNMDSQAYEDTLREMFGIHAYITFTLDKVVSNAVRQLQHLVTDDPCIECHELFNSEAKNGATGGLCGKAHERQIAELVYQKKAEKILADENCMKIFIYHQSGRMTVEMIDTETDGQNGDDDPSAAQKWHSYIEHFIQPGEEVSESTKRNLLSKPVFLPRGIRSYSKSSFAAKVKKLPNHILGVESAKRRKDDEDSENESDDKSKDTDTESKDSTTAVKRNVLSNGVIYEDNTQCNFNPKNFKMLYVINSEKIFYRKLALRRALMSHKKVSQRKTSDFNRWHDQWLSDNVTESQQSAINEWFMGKTEGLVPNRTLRIERNDHNRTPYRTFSKFKAELL